MEQATVTEVTRYVVINGAGAVVLNTDSLERARAAVKDNRPAVIRTVYRILH